MKLNLFSLLLLSAASNAAVVNGSFEDPAVTGSTNSGLPDVIFNTTSMTGWSMISLAADWVNASSSSTIYTAADDGDYYVGFTQATHGIEQTISGLTPGLDYELSFAYAGGTLVFNGAWSFASSAGDDSNVAIFDSPTASPTVGSALGSVNPVFTAPNVPATVNDPFTPSWQTTSFTFTAPVDGDVTLIVNFGGTQNGQLNYDDFQLTAIPEPSSSFLIGLAGLACISRRLRR